MTPVSHFVSVGDMEAMVEGRRQKLGPVCRRSVGPLLSTAT